MKENRIREVLKSIAQRDIPDNVNMWPQIAAKVERKDFMQTVRARPALALVLVFLALALLSGVAYAIGKATGYIPGVGIVDQSAPLRVLAEPIVVEREGITVGVYQVVATKEYTFVAYAFDDIVMPKDTPAMCGASPSLQLPDGTTLEVLSGDSGGFGGEAGKVFSFETAVNYSPIPANIDRVILTLDCVLPAGTGPENWELPLVLVPAPKGFATPAMQVGATFVAAGPTFDVAPTPTLEREGTPVQADPSLPNTATPVPNGSGLYLDEVIELPDSYILVGNFTDAGDLPGPFLATGSAYDYVPRIEDENGNPVEFIIRDDIKPVIHWVGVQYWAYEIAKPVDGPITITLDEIMIDSSDTVQFVFDTGPNPQPGQIWQLNLPIHLGRYDYVVDSVEMLEDGYDVKWHSGPEVPEGTSFQLNILNGPTELGPTSGSEDRRNSSVVRYSQNITYLVPPPTGQLTAELTLFETIPLQGPWTLTWTPPNK